MVPSKGSRLMGRQRATTCRDCGTTEDLLEGICRPCRAERYRLHRLIRKREAWIRLMSWQPPRAV